MKKTPTPEYQLRSKGPVPVKTQAAASNGESRVKAQSTLRQPTFIPNSTADQQTEQPNTSNQTNPEQQHNPEQPRTMNQDQSTDQAPARRVTNNETGRPPFNVEIVGKFDPCKDNARSWLARYEYFGKVAETSAELLAKFFGMFLMMGAAFDWYTSLEENVTKDFELLKTKFLQRFSKKIDPVQITSELFQMKQKSNQTVRDFVYSVQSKARLADISPENTLSAINGGLLSHIRADLRRNPPKTLEELIETAERSEGAYALHPPQINFSPETFTEIVKNAIGGVNMLELKQQVESLAENQKSINSFTERERQNFNQHPRSNNSLRNNRSNNFRQNNKTFQVKGSNDNKVNLSKCYACGELLDTHDFRNCWAKTKTCFTCKKNGHISRACGLKKQ